MKKILALAVTSAIALAAATPAFAAPYLFSYTSGNATKASFSGSFTIDSSPVPSNSNANKGFFEVANVTGTFSPEGYTSSSVDFFLTGVDAGNGGFALIAPPGSATAGNTYRSFTGPQLFTGSVSAPTFLTGTFALSNNTTLTISGVTSAVPEPAAWALMILGFGAVGTSLRRRQKVTVRYA